MDFLINMLQETYEGFIIGMAIFAVALIGFIFYLCRRNPEPKEGL